MTKKEIMMIKQIQTILYIGMFFTYMQAANIEDQDFDGVPDSLDECANTPFLNVVNQKGCTTDILLLPFETDSKNFIATLGYGYSTNEDLMSRADQKNTKLKLSYYQNSWSFTLQSGYYSDGMDSGTLDTVLRVQKRILPHPKFAINLGAGVRLPTYNFEGNRVDGLAYASLHYYPTKSLSFFTGASFTKIGDDAVMPSVEELADSDNENATFRGLQDKYKFYIGSGYFFTDNFYVNIVYSEEQSKFVGEHHIQELASTLYYKINTNWFTTLYYKREPWDNDLHDNFLFSIGYSLW